MMSSGIITILIGFSRQSQLSKYSISLQSSASQTLKVCLQIKLVIKNHYIYPSGIYNDFTSQFVYALSPSQQTALEKPTKLHSEQSMMQSPSAQKFLSIFQQAKQNHFYILKLLQSKLMLKCFNLKYSYLFTQMGTIYQFLKYSYSAYLQRIMAKILHKASENQEHSLRTQEQILNFHRCHNILGLKGEKQQFITQYISKLHFNNRQKQQYRFILYILNQLSSDYLDLLSQLLNYFALKNRLQQIMFSQPKVKIILAMFKDQLEDHPEDLLKANRFGVPKLRLVVLLIGVMIMYLKLFKLRIILWFQTMFKTLRTRMILAYSIILVIKAQFLLVAIQKIIISMAMIKYYHSFQVRPLNHVIIQQVAMIRALKFLRLEELFVINLLVNHELALLIQQDYHQKVSFVLFEELDLKLKYLHQARLVMIHQKELIVLLEEFQQVRQLFVLILLILNQQLKVSNPNFLNDDGDGGGDVQLRKNNYFNSNYILLLKPS